MRQWAASAATTDLAPPSTRGREQPVVGTIGGHTQSFLATHRESNDTPITAVVTLTVPMSH